MDGSAFVERDYEEETGYGVGDRVRLESAAFALRGMCGIIVGIEEDLRYVESGQLANDRCFCVRLATGSVVYVTPAEFERYDP